MFVAISVCTHHCSHTDYYTSLFLHGLFIDAQSKEDDVNALKNETQRLNKMRETIQRKLRGVEDQKADTEGQRDTLKGHIGGLEKG